MNAHGALLDAWYSLLSGISVPVYKGDVFQEEDGHYVVISIEGGQGQNNKRTINDDVVITVNVVTIFENNADVSVAESIDAEVFDLVLPTSGGVGLTEASGIQILNVNRETFDYVHENDNKKVYYRKVSRYRHRIHQTA